MYAHFERHPSARTILDTSDDIIDTVHAMLGEARFRFSARQGLECQMPRERGLVLLVLEPYITRPDSEFFSLDMRIFNVRDKTLGYSVEGVEAIVCLFGAQCSASTLGTPQGITKICYGPLSQDREYIFITPGGPGSELVPKNPFEAPNADPDGEEWPEDLLQVSGGRFRDQRSGKDRF